MTHHGDVLIRFDQVTFHYDPRKDILKHADFSVRERAKITIMGQNGAGKSTIFKLLTGELQPVEGQIHVKKGTTIGIARQVVPPADLEKTVKEFFAGAFREKKHDLDRHIAKVLDAVNFKDAALDKKIKAFSGGQKARLLLAFAIIQEPDILLLDEPTNNLDDDGIGHLLSFLISYEKTVIVISHDANFLNAFTDGVIYLDAFLHQTNQYVGDYHDVVSQIQDQIEREQRQNAQMEKKIQDQKDKINFFSHKGGKMRKLASKMRDAVEEAEESMVDVRQEDRTIANFTIPISEFTKPLAVLSSVTIIKGGKPVSRTVETTIYKGWKLRITGPNGIGKTTLLEHMANGTEKGVQITPGVKVGYYRQDFSGLPFEKTGYEILAAEQEMENRQEIFATAARFLIPGDKLSMPVGALSEGQKGLLCFARFVLQKPTLLILDEPTNHINFRHIPVIAEALSVYEGGMIVVSHDQDFINQLEISEEMDLGRL